MADQIIHDEGTLTLSSGFRLLIGSMISDCESVHVPFTDTTFRRDRGKTYRPVVASGVEVFSSSANMDTFLSALESVAASSSCEIKHNTLTTGLTAAPISINRAESDTNIYPGFHVFWEILFHEYPA